MRRVALGQAGMDVPQVVAGMMRIGAKTDAEIRRLFDAALDTGITFFDHADLYGFDVADGQYHWCEQRFGQALRLSAADREQIILQSKVGIHIDPPGYDHSYGHIVSSVEDSLRALGTDYLDILLLHRPDALAELEEVARAFSALQAAGKVRHFGVSNHTPGQIELLAAALDEPLVANQIQVSLIHAPAIAQGINANTADLAQSAGRDGGVVDFARREKLTLQAWSPLQTGAGQGGFLSNPAFGALNKLLEELAAAYHVEPAAIAIAWLTRHPADMQVVLGTTNPQRLQAAAQGADIRLTRPEWYALYHAAGHTLP